MAKSLTFVLLLTGSVSVALIILLQRSHQIRTDARTIAIHRGLGASDQYLRRTRIYKALLSTFCAAILAWILATLLLELVMKLNAGWMAALLPDPAQQFWAGAAFVLGVSAAGMLAGTLPLPRSGNRPAKIT